MFVGGSLEKGFLGGYKWKLDVKIVDFYDFHNINSNSVTNRLNNLLYNDQNKGYLSNYNVNVIFTDKISV